MKKIKTKVIYEWTLWFVAIGLLAAFIVLLVYYNNDAWIGITTICILWFVISAITSFRVFNSEFRTANVKLCWILAIMCFPFIGLIVYFWFGIFPFRKVHFDDYNKIQKDLAKNENFTFTKEFLKNNVDDRIGKIFRYGLNIERPVTENNEVQVIDTPDKLYRAMIEAINGAKYFINIQTYIVRKSTIFRTLANALIKKAKEGVAVNFMYDWVGGLFYNPKEKLREMKEAGINVATFNTFKYNPFTGQTNYRSHRKCLIVDNEIAVYGGSNWSDDYFDIVQKNNFWKDLNWFIKGPIVNSMNVVYAIDWTHFTFKSIPEEVKKQFLLKPEFYFRKPEFHKTVSSFICQFVESSPLLRHNVIMNDLVNAIGSATKRIWIVTPYLYPSESIMDQLIAASLSGIDVRLIVPGNADDKDYIMLINRYNYKKLLNAGAKIYEYYGFIHGKQVIIDDNIAFLGTFNLDHRSLYSNFETSLILYSKTEIEKIAKQYEELIKCSKEVNLTWWKTTQTFWRREQLYFINIFHPLF